MVDRGDVIRHSGRPAYALAHTLYAKRVCNAVRLRGAPPFRAIVEIPVRGRPARLGLPLWLPRPPGPPMFYQRRHVRWVSFLRALRLRLVGIIAQQVNLYERCAKVGQARNDEARQIFADHQAEVNQVGEVVVRYALQVSAVCGLVGYFVKSAGMAEAVEGRALRWYHAVPFFL